MTYIESDYAIIVNKLNNIIKNENNPAIAYFKMKKTLELLDKLPVYPHLVEQIIDESISETLIEDIETGDDILILNEKETYSAKLKEKTDEGVKLSNVFKTSQSKSKTLTQEKISKIITLKKKK